MQPVMVVPAFLLLGSAAWAAAHRPRCRPWRRKRALTPAQWNCVCGRRRADSPTYATPAIERMFATPEKFIAMVRSADPVVGRSASVDSRRIEWAEGYPTQAVQTADIEGGIWPVAYRLERQADRSWPSAPAPFEQLGPHGVSGRIAMPLGRNRNADCRFAALPRQDLP